MSGHLPILTVIKCELLEYHLNENRHVAWNKCSYEQLSLYRSTLEQEQEHINLQEQCCAADVDLFYENIVNAIHKAANDALPHSKFNKHTKPYWTPEVSTQSKETSAENGSSREDPDNVKMHSLRRIRNQRAVYVNYKKEPSRIANVELKYYIDFDSSAIVTYVTFGTSSTDAEKSNRLM